MQAKELRELSDQELSTKELTLRESIFRLRIRRGTGQLDNPASLAEARKQIARIKTIVRERTRTESQK